MNTAKFPTELEETKLVDTDGYTLVSDGEGKAKKMRPSVTHTRTTYSDDTIAKYTKLLDEEGKNIVVANKNTKNGNLTNEEVYLRTADGSEVVYAQRDKDAETGNLTHDEVYLRTPDGSDVVSAQRDKDAETGNLTHDEVYLRTADGTDVVSAQRNLTDEGNLTHDEVYLRTPDGSDVVYAQRDKDAETGNLTHDEVYLRTADGNDVVSAQRDFTDDGQLTHDELYLHTAEGNGVVYAQRNLTDEGNVTHDEVYLRTAEGNDVVKCERTFDANGDETDKQTTLFAKSLKSLKVETADGTFTAEQLACGSGRTNGTVHQITSATQTIDIQGETISVFEVDASMSATPITVTLQNVPKSTDPNVLLGCRLVVINHGQVHCNVCFITQSLSGVISMKVSINTALTRQVFTMNGLLFDNQDNY